MKKYRAMVLGGSEVHPVLIQHDFNEKSDVDAIESAKREWPNGVLKIEEIRMVIDYRDQ